MAEKPTYGQLEKKIGELEEWADRHMLLGQSVQEKEARYQAIVQAFDGLIYICSKDFRVEYMNDHFIRRTGYNAVGELCYKALHDRDSICPWCVNERVFKGETVKWEVQSPKDDRWYYVVNTPIYHADGSMSKQAMILDISERKHAEENLRIAYAEMENRVEERTSELLEANRELHIEMVARKAYQDRLRDLSSELLLAEESERRRIAMDLHDRVGQSLAITKMKLTQMRMAHTSPDTPALLDEIRELVDHVIRDIRSLTFEISPNILYELGLEAALEWLADNMREQQNFAIDYKDDESDKPLDDRSRFLLFRAARELLFNVVKHARADHVTITSKRVGNDVVIELSDNGIGFDTSELRNFCGKSMRFGIFSIRERLENLGGHFAVESEPGRGSRFVISAPLSNPEKLATDGIFQ